MPVTVVENLHSVPFPAQLRVAAVHQNSCPVAPTSGYWPATADILEQPGPAALPSPGKTGPLRQFQKGNADGMQAQYRVDKMLWIPRVPGPGGVLATLRVRAP